VGDNDLGLYVGSKEPESVNYSEGIIFSETYYDGEYAYVATSYIGEDIDLIIPGYFKGKKVVGIGNSFLDSVEYPRILLRSVYIPKEIVFIGAFAFAFNLFDNDYSIMTIGFEENSKLKRIGDFAFAGVKLTNIELPLNLEFIGSYAFKDSQFIHIVIPASVSHIGISAFSQAFLSSINIEGDELRFNDVWSNIGFPEELKPS